jgi:hypothetical protein
VAVQVPALGGVDLTLELAHLLHQLVHLVVVDGFAHLHADLVEAVELGLHFGHALFDVPPDVLGRIQLRLLGQVAHLDGRIGFGFADEVVVEPRHDLQQG